MQGKEKAQLTLAQISGLFSGPLVPKGSFYDQLRTFGETVVHEEDFASLYAPGMGRPSLPPVFMCKVLLLQFHDGVSDQEAEERARFDLRWKWALNLWLDGPGFESSSLTRFRALLVTGGKERVAFDAFLRMAMENKVLKPGGLSLIDSTAVLGAGAVESTWQLLRHAVRKVKKKARKVAGLTAMLDEVLQRKDYMDRQKPVIDWQDPAARDALLNEVVTDARQAVRAVHDALGDELAKAPELAGAVDLLSRIAGQDIEEKEDGTVGVRQGVAKDRIVSVTDPQMRHGRKTSSGKFNGTKGHVAIDEATELVTDVAVMAAGAADQEPVAGSVDRQESMGIKPGTVMGDHAYGYMELRDEMAKRSVDVVAPVGAGHGVGGKFGKKDFVIDAQARTCRCPAGRDGSARYDQDGYLKAFMFGKACDGCPLRARCTSSRGGRVVQVHRREADLQRLRAAQLTEDFRTRYHRRPKVERGIAHLKAHGMGRARYRTNAGRLLQFAFTAVVVNIEKWQRLMATAATAGAV